ncbi:mitochondrial ribosomal protein S18A [Lycorma delicatula]|uniref:mitochondrial ribosomal protein S18A n=1 Tax=Lycorma delicatula TaxID=130591 RepID=UPI003F517C54
MLRTLSSYNLTKYSNLLSSFCNQSRSLSITPVSRVKEIVVNKEGKNTIIEGVILPSPREGYMLKTLHLHEHEKEACPICRLNLDVKHTDVLILSQFIRSDGCMLPRRVTGLCRLQQKRVSKMVTMALKAGLMPNRAPANSKRDPSNRDKFKKNHRYYDETTIIPPAPLRVRTN